MELDKEALEKAIADATRVVGEMMRKDPLPPPLNQIMYLGITAYLAEMAERGVRLMPGEPTSKMVDAGTAKWNSVSTAPRRASIEFDNEVFDVWTAMFDAHSEPKP